MRWYAERKLEYLQTLARYGVNPDNISAHELAQWQKLYSLFGTKGLMPHKLSLEELRAAPQVPEIKRLVRSTGHKELLIYGFNELGMLTYSDIVHLLWPNSWVWTRNRGGGHWEQRRRRPEDAPKGRAQDVIKVQICRLRQSYSIEAIWGRGYRLLPESVRLVARSIAASIAPEIEKLVTRQIAKALGSKRESAIDYGNGVPAIPVPLLSKKGMT